MASTRLDRCQPSGLLVRIHPRPSETFILGKILDLQRLGVRLRVSARAPPADQIAHPAGARVRAAQQGAP